MSETSDTDPQYEKPNADGLQTKLERAMMFHRQGTLADAERIYLQILEQQPNHFDAVHLLGVIAKQTRRAERAVELIRKAIGLDARVAAAHSNLAAALLDVRRPKEALASCDKAIELAPDFAMAHNNRAHALLDLKRLEEAVASCDRALALNPEFAEAYSNRALALIGLRRPEEALASCDRAIALKPDFAEAFNNRGWALLTLYHYGEAFVAFDKAFELNPNLTGAEGDRLHSKMRICNWRNFEPECTHLIASVNSGLLTTSPFIFLTIPSSSEEQLKCSSDWITNKFAFSDAPAWRGERFSHKRIHIAYLSADFRQHATAFLMAGMFECHDKSRFDITAISFGQNDTSAMRQQIEASAEHFIDADKYSDDQIVELVAALEIDLAIDLKGFTTDSRTSIFARRLAPVQINYLGYPGTMGAPYIDYIIADRTVIPEEHRAFYSEKIVYLPNTYQANDATRHISDRKFTRIELGLPQSEFVFCCFNNNYKITPHIFDCWMRILKKVEGSVLWLFEDNKAVASNLRNEAAAREVDCERLVFASRVSPSDHLARHRCANLFLDTLPCNAHTTASDALWAGLPVLTCLGETFAGRVAASLLNAIGLPELITTTLEAYEQTAIDLAVHPEKLAIINRKLDENRLTTPLFDTKLFTKHIEAAYAAMYQRHQAGLAPDHIFVRN